MKIFVDLIIRGLNPPNHPSVIFRGALRVAEVGSAVQLRWRAIGMLVLTLAVLCPSLAWAQSVPCTPDETLTKFSFGSDVSQGVGASSAAWPAGSLSNSFAVSNQYNPITYNTISFNITPSPTMPFIATQTWVGGDKYALELSMDASASGQSATVTIVFNRPMDKVSFSMYDMDANPTVTTPSTVVGWQDVVRVAGYLNSVPATPPVLVPTTPARQGITSVAEYSQITPVVSGNCGTTNAICNFNVNFSDPVDRIVVVFEAGPSIADPALQVVGLNNFSYCVPQRDLRLLKTASAGSMVAGKTATYSLTVANRGGVSTAGNVMITDIITTPGVAFTSPQAPVGWSCTFSNTIAANDTANCSRATVINGGGTASLSLVVSVSPDATATAVVNRAKVYGGGDPNKLTFSATGPVDNCNASNENQSGGGGATNAGCAYESTGLARQAFLSVAKTNGVSTLLAGGTISYVLTFTNAGPSDAPGSVVSDPVVAGLDCNTLSFASSPPGMVNISPFPPTVGAMQGAGITLASFPANSSANFTLTCGVTATGQ